MMTIQELDAVPIGGRVKTDGGYVWELNDNQMWQRGIQVLDMATMKDFRNALSPITEPQTWQDVARAAGWFVAQDGSFAGRFLKEGFALVISENERGFWVVGPDEEHDARKCLSITEAIEVADRIAGGDWA